MATPNLVDDELSRDSGPVYSEYKLGIPYPPVDTSLLCQHNFEHKVPESIKHMLA